MNGVTNNEQVCLYRPKGRPWADGAGPWAAHESVGLYGSLMGFRVLVHGSPTVLSYCPMGRPWVTLEVGMLALWVSHRSPIGRSWVVESASPWWVSHEFMILSHASPIGLECWPMGHPWVGHGSPMSLRCRPI